MTLLGLGLLLTGNWILPLIDRDEPRFAEASREMLQRRDFIVPHFNGDYRFDKPPLIYWCQTASYSVLGENAFAARLPSALFATATGLLLLLWGCRMGQLKAGLFAAVMFLSCLQILVYGRLAIADMPMVFFFTLAVWSGWEMSRPGDAGFGWWWLFYTSLGLGFLAKGPEAWLPLLGIWIGRWRRPDSFRVGALSTIAGLLFSLAIIGFWAVPALRLTHGEFFRVGIGHHVIQRSLGVMEGHGARGWLGYIAWLPFYFFTFFVSFFPWSIWTPKALREGVADDLPWLLLIQSAIVFAVFTLSATKLPHYTMPAFPCLALCLAFRMNAAKIRAGLITAGVLMAVALGACFWFQTHLLATNLWRAVGADVQPATRVAAVDFHEASLVWEFRQTSTNYVQFVDKTAAPAFLRKPGPACLIMPIKDWATAPFSKDTNLIIQHVTGTDTAGFHHWDVVAAIRK